MVKQSYLYEQKIFKAVWCVPQMRNAGLTVGVGWIKLSKFVSTVAMSPESPFLPNGSSPRSVRQPRSHKFDQKSPAFLHIPELHALFKGVISRALCNRLERFVYVQKLGIQNFAAMHIRRPSSREGDKLIVHNPCTRFQKGKSWVKDLRPMKKRSGMQQA